MRDRGDTAMKILRVIASVNPGRFKPVLLWFFKLYLTTVNNENTVEVIMALRVLQVVQSYYPAFVYGGPIFSIHYACQALARQGVAIEVATTNANGKSKLEVETGSPILFEPNYLVRYYNDTIISRFSWDFTIHLWTNLKNAKVVHLQDVFSTYAAWTLMLAKLARKPILISARGTFIPWGLQSKRPWLKKLWLAFLVRPFVGNGKRVSWHATSDQERMEILAQFPKARVHIIPNGIDSEAFDKLSVPSRNDYFARFFSNSNVAPDRAKVLVGLGRLHAKKTFDVAIRALHVIGDAQPDTVLLIAGADDGVKESLAKLVAELGLSSRVALVGEVNGSDKIFFLKGADMFLFPSHGENFGNVALEALAAGVPVIASRNTPWAEIERQGAGLWVDNTPEAFAIAIAKLLDRNLEGLREQARRLASQYEINVIAKQFKTVYEDMIND